MGKQDALSPAGANPLAQSEISLIPEVVEVLNLPILTMS